LFLAIIEQVFKKEPLDGFVLVAVLVFEKDYLAIYVNLLLQKDLAL